MIEVTYEMIRAYIGGSEITEPDAHRVRDGLKDVMEIVNREVRAQRRAELREIRREIGQLNAVTGYAMRAAALTVLFNREHAAVDE